MSADTAYADVNATGFSNGVVIEHVPGSEVWTIHAPNGSIINYSSFDIFQGQLVQFLQGNPNYRVLNRVDSLDPSIIEGTLRRADGIVYLVNPAGVFFDGNAVVDVGGIYAAAGNISDGDFVAGIDNFDLTGDVVVGHGARVKGTDIHLLGQRVANHGLLKSGGGIITMLAGENVFMYKLGERLIVEVDGTQLTDLNAPLNGGTSPSMLATPAVENTGRIVNDGGRVILGAGDMASLAFRNTGTIRAAGGEINVVAADGLIQNDGKISASSRPSDGGGRGGVVTVQGPSVLNSGRITADSHDGRAGSVEVTSQNHTYLRSGSRISAAGKSGDARGGEVLVHSYGGLTIFADGSVIDVSGGRLGGRGGYAEVSGHALTFNGKVNTKARNGSKHGELLIDPVTITVNETGGNDDLLDDGIIEFGDDPDDVAISAAAIQAVMGLIRLEATEQIIFEAAVGLVNMNDVELLSPDGSIIFRKNLTGAADLAIVANTIRFEGSRALTANESIFLYGDIEADRDLTLTAGLLGMGHLSLFGTVDVARDADFSSAQGIFAFGKMEIGRDATFTSNNMFLRGPNDANGDSLPTRIRTGGDQTYTGHLHLANDTRLIASDGAITFGDKIDSRGSALPPDDPRLTVIGKTVSFGAAVGAGIPLRSLVVRAQDGIDVAGDLMVTREFQRYHDAVTLLGDTTFQSQSPFPDFPIEEGTIRFFDQVTGNHDMTVNTAGLTRFQGDVDVATLTTDAGGRTRLGADNAPGMVTITAGRVELNDDVFIAQDTEILASESVAFGRTVDGEGHSLTIDSKQTTFERNLKQLDVLRTKGGNVNINAKSIKGRELRLGGKVRLADGEQISLIGEELVKFGNRVDGAADLSVQSDLKVVFGGNVGDSTTLASLTVDAGTTGLVNDNVILIDGNSVTVEGDIVLNREGKEIPSLVASIGGSSDLKIVSNNGNFFMGRNEKITAVGDLEIAAANGRVTLGDLNSFGDMTVYGDEIFVWAREGGSRLTASGRIVQDLGADIVAGGKLQFSKVPSLRGNGRTPIVVADVFSDLSPTIRSFIYRSLISLAASDFMFNLTILDLGDPSFDSLAEALDGDGLAEDTDRLRGYFDLEPFALRQMDQLGIYMREMDETELLANADGCALYNDAPAGLVNDPQPPIVTMRLRRSSVLRVLDRHAGIFLAEPVDAETGVQDRAPEIMTTLASAWDDCRETYGDAISGNDFRVFVRESAEHEACRVLLDDLEDLVQEIWTMGATPYEMQISMDRILTPIARDDDERRLLQQAITPERLQISLGGRDRDPLTRTTKRQEPAKQNAVDAG